MPDSSSSDVVTLWYQALAQDKLLICTLGPAHPQQVLRLYFFARDVVTLYTCGHGTVNLLGYASVRRTPSTSLSQFSSSSEQTVPVNLSEEDDSSNDVCYPNEARSAGVGDEKSYPILKGVKSKKKTESTGGDESKSSTSLSAESDEEESCEDIPEKSETAVEHGQKQKGSKTVEKYESVKLRFAAEEHKTRKTSKKVKSKTNRGLSAK
ncbi:unnamed protein product [Acanthosepion pharaonis]|uniref:Nucleoplasmin-like domain-containing protein n=1 Tax=Acanthosepion pharaonis TaxID=158019 RepID=A0A812ECY8_ACAPH|nr:unnamed protein product [Sepia pharaonis]